MLRNIGAAELLYLVLLVLWVIGVVKLYRKNQMVLFWISIAGLIVPVIALVGYAGWFVSDRSHERAADDDSRASPV